MADELYRDEIRDRATSSSNLSARLKANRKGSARDFHAWVIGNLAPKPDQRVLDVGCGTGSQSLPVSKVIGPSGSVSAMDFSEESIAGLLSADEIGNIEAVAGNMNQLQEIISGQFTHKRYDLAQSAYAIYYADNPIAVLETMHASLNKGGRMAITVPALPHGLVELAGGFTTIPPQTRQSLEFGRKILEPWFRKTFWEPSIHLFKNTVTIKTTDELLASFRTTVYHDEAAEAGMVKIVERAIREHGTWVYEKNAMMICATCGN